ncbi:uncharacterized protein EV422DRAFT_540345 [Fimicolochytrium jonesii]|uniref:uncharacterized protein n=1 Tax=Fimicolochytrium jonesii TaxID=1396493 RepID=UPI0022FE6F0D|nr:uncharacterized protein EV422DRAFT_540345 [Fimicolochytrium jonesii]KAI8817635.1 hypothetical protein EV422DRAFT_540345 [Fimicolochytrium jonesii]
MTQRLERALFLHGRLRPNLLFANLLLLCIVIGLYLHLAGQSHLWSSGTVVSHPPGANSLNSLAPINLQSPNSDAEVRRRRFDARVHEVFGIAGQAASGRSHIASEHVTRRLGINRMFQDSEALNVQARADPPSFRWVVFTCHCAGDIGGPDCICGGLGDRLKGCVSAYYYGVFTNRAFAISMTFPDDVRSYLVPSNLDWSLDLAKLHGRTEVTVNLIDPPDDDRALLDGPDSWNDYDVVYVRTNRDLLSKMLQNHSWQLTREKYSLQNYHRESLVGSALRTLFQASPRMEHMLESIRKSIPNYRRLIKIGIQFRAGGQTGEGAFEHDTGGHRTSLDMANCFIARAVQFALDRRLRTDEVVYFLTSDHEAIQSQMSETLNDLGYKTFTTTGPLTHIDKPVHEAGDQSQEMKHRRTYIDWFLEAEMDYLVISRSGFGETAHFYTLNPTVRIRSVENNCVFDNSTDHSLWPVTSSSKGAFMTD